MSVRSSVCVSEVVIFVSMRLSVRVSEVVMFVSVRSCLCQ